MHGVIFVELKKFVDARLGEAAWTELTDGAGLHGRAYLPVQDYPDAEALALIEQAVAATGLEVDGLLQQFGEFMAPDILRMYGSLLQRDWRTLEVVEHTEPTTHRVMRARNPAACPVGLRVERVGPDELLVTYQSPRKMCGLAKGIVRGMARHFREQVSIEEPSCMREGAPQCLLRLRRS
jgi:hypothetical protein